MTTVRYRVHDVDAALPFCRALPRITPTGARFRSPPIKGPGGRQVLVEGPSGNPIELFEARVE